VTRRALAALAAVSVALAACGIDDDARPRLIGSEDGASELEDATPNSQPALGASFRIYLLVAQAPGQTPRLQAVTREIDPNATALFTALTAGLNASEQSDRLRSAVPTATELLAAPAITDGVITLDLSDAIFEATGNTLVDALAQIVFTMSELPGVSAVQLRVNGVPQEWPTGDGTLTSAPLRVFDYPERNPTSQPDYPSAPPVAPS
jgi:spore germination protein GerM